MQQDKRLIVALDTTSIRDAWHLTDAIGDACSFYKIGLSLHSSGANTLIRCLHDSMKSVFLDFKFFDIGKTMENAVKRACSLGVDFVTIHGVGGVIQAAKRGVEGHTKLLAVTVLTSLEANDIHAMGFPCDVDTLVKHRARLAYNEGIDGVVCSALEAPMVRDVTGDDFIIVCPGIRVEDHVENDDQRRIVTPKCAFALGANHIVVGRPITEASDPRTAAQNLVRSINVTHYVS
jgi:orotidine-5'-phosphate decarboxylase